MADDPNLVSEVQIQGIDKSTAELKTYGDEGAAAFNKIADAADKASGTVSGSSDKIAKGLGSIADAAPKTDIVKRLTDIGAAVGDAASKMGSAGARVAEFGGSIKALQAASIGAIVGIGKFAASVTAAARSTNTAINDQLQLQKKQNEGLNQAAGDAAQYQVAQNKLNRDVANGTITGSEYNKQLTELKASYRDQVTAHQQVQTAQLETLRLNQALERQAAQRQAFDDLAKTYGSTLAGSLIQLGTAYDSVYKKVVQAFGPVIAQLVDSVTNLVQKNSAAITKFISDAAAGLSAFIAQSGPSIAQVSAFVSDLGNNIVRVIVNVAIPAFQGLLTVLNTVATAINGMFGTNINGTFLLVIALVLQLTGGLGALLSVIQLIVAVVGALVTAFGIVPVAIIAIVAAIAVFLATQVDWAKYAKAVTDAWQAVETFISTSIARVQQFFTDAINFITQAWTDLGTAISTGFTNALNAISTTVSSWASTLLSYIQPIIDKLKTVADLLGLTGGGGGDAASVSAATGGHIRGPGTSTSDSIPAWLSNNEFVMRAKAVTKYGVGFMRAINSGKLDLGAIARFAAGGLVSMPTQPRYAYATGGLVQGKGSDRVLNLSIDGQEFNGLMMPEEVGNRLTTYAVSRQTRSAGRKPSWVGGKK
jgi:hypothetical protein